MKRLVYMLAAVVAVAGVAVFVWQEKRFALPGPLGLTHAALESDCFACHDEDRHVDNAKCASCHTNPDTGDPVAFAGFARHHTFSDLNCIECHTDHGGAEASLTRATHGLEQTGCSQCHDRTMGKDATYRLAGPTHPAGTLHSAHVPWQDDCETCHAKDGGVPSAKCIHCHQTPKGQPVRFTGFAKHHTYHDLNCIECHTEHAGPAASLTRVTHGLEQIGCTTCHDRTMGKDVTYQLAGASHPSETLHSAHAPWQGNCESCHTPGGGVASAKCTGCHDDRTGKAVKFTGFARHHAYADLDCLACHTAHRGREGMLLRRGKSFPKAGCATCHARHVGPRHEYKLAADKHPVRCVRRIHSPWEANCESCHSKDAGSYNCTTCHDPETGKQLVLKGFASHHFRKDLNCLDCHSEHRRAEGHPVTKAGVTFDKTPCQACHPQAQRKPVSLAAMPVALRGGATSFPHDKHSTQKQKSLSCDRCHPMTPGRPHELVSPYNQNCSSCHHGPAQKTSCITCHKQTADYFAGQFEGRIVKRGTHGRSGEVACKACHPFDAKTNTFKPPASTCSDCHPAAYTKVFLKNRDEWRQWRQAVDALPKDHANAKQLQFVGRYWYHNDAQSAKVRKANPAPAAPTAPVAPAKGRD